MDRKTKEALKVETAERFQKATAAIIAQYRGMTVAELTELRRNLRKSNAEFKVLKNRVAKKALEQDVPAAKDLAPLLKGPIGLVLVYGDAAAASKTVLDYAKGHPNLVVGGGLFENKVVSSADIKALSDLPSKEVLLARIVGSLVSPHRNFLGVMTGIHRNVLNVLNAIKDKKSQ